MSVLTSEGSPAVGPDQHFSGMPEIVECVYDCEAVDKAMQLANGLDLEIGTPGVWLRGFRVARLGYIGRDRSTRANLPQSGRSDIRRWPCPRHGQPNVMALWILSATM